VRSPSVLTSSAHSFKFTSSRKGSRGINAAQVVMSECEAAFLLFSSLPPLAGRRMSLLLKSGGVLSTVDKRDGKKRNVKPPLTRDHHPLLGNESERYMLPGKRVRTHREPPAYRISPAEGCPAYRNLTSPSFSILALLLQSLRELIYRASTPGRFPGGWEVPRRSWPLFGRAPEIRSEG
jgi:hypothetical protein